MHNIAHQLAALLGDKGWLTGRDTAPYVRDWLNRYGVEPIGVARPATTGEVSDVVKACFAASVAIVPQGGNTSLCGGAIAGEHDSIILSLSRMTKIGEPDRASGTILVEAGVVLAALHAALESHGLIFPLHLGAEGSARIGGLIGTNAGGSHAYRYGVMENLVLGLEIVLDDGSIWNGLRSVQKDNAGYQLRKLFCGSEGTLGVITRAVLKLYPSPRQRATALLALPDYSSAVAFGVYLRAEMGEFLSGCEFFSDFGLGLALKHVPDLNFPLEARAPVYALVEVATSSSLTPLSDMLSGALEHGLSEGLLLDGALAMSDAQRQSFWRIREEQPEGQRLEGAQLKFDISVPPGSLGSFIEAAEELCRKIFPGVRINPFGHLADGNIHYNLSAPVGQAGFAEATEELGWQLAALATNMEGSFAAEHGLGRSKLELANHSRSLVERNLMAKLKHALDPRCLMNPGVLVSGAERKE